MIGEERVVQYESLTPDARREIFLGSVGIDTPAPQGEDPSAELSLDELQLFTSHALDADDLPAADYYSQRLAALQAREQ